jgi:radical SAM protein with 4Fe4S-binding SPASM domain
MKHAKRYLAAGKNVLLKPMRVEEDACIHIQLEPTTSCNLKCRSCPHESYVKKPKHMSLESFTKVFDQIKPRKITLSGLGEPFSNPGLPGMIGYAKLHGASINTTSNLTVINDALAAKIVDSGLDLLKISIDAFDPETYRSIRDSDYHGRILKAIRAINARKAEKGVAHPALRFNFVVQGKNYKEMADLVRLAVDLKVEAIYFQPLEMVGLDENAAADLVGNMTSADLLEELKRAKKVAADAGLETNLPAMVSGFKSIWKKYVSLGAQEDRKICPLPWFSTYVTVEGDMRPCCSFPTTPEANLGNVLKDGFKEAWNGDRYKDFRKKIKAGKRPYKICQNCVPMTVADMVKYARVLPGFLRG